MLFVRCSGRACMLHAARAGVCVQKFRRLHNAVMWQLFLEPKKEGSALQGRVLLHELTQRRPEPQPR